MKSKENPHVIAAKQATGFGKFSPYVERLGGTLERYSTHLYGIRTNRHWVTGTKEQILEIVHHFILEYNHEN
ncbi:MAG: hypothetical protein RIM23_10015 [Coleofasciculus sp. G3-WIS-01]|uniref:hypothetical protein n=1 Tax=Coleofasciculus sp. G3-WIS-01 TaxID=3069528 RepID=UPI0032F9B319